MEAQKCLIGINNPQVKLHGLGLQEAYRSASIAFMSSCNRSRDLVSHFLHFATFEKSSFLIDGESSAKEVFLQNFGTF